MVFEALEVQVEAELGEQQLDKLRPDSGRVLLVFVVEVLTLGRFGPQSLVGCRQHHLIEVSEIQIAIGAAAVELDKEKHVLRLKDIFDIATCIFGLILDQEFIDGFVVKTINLLISHFSTE